MLVVTAFFEAVDEITEAAGLGDSEITRDEQVALAADAPFEGDWLQRLLSSPLPVPSPDLTNDDLRALLLRWFLRSAERLSGFLTGLLTWEQADPSVQWQVLTRMETDLPTIALRRFDEAHLRLSAEIPDFALWTERLDTAARHRELRRSLDGLEAFLRRTTQGSDPERHRA